MREEIINLGKALVKELELETERDTLSEWMAHYIAEQLVIIDSTTGKKKKEAEKQCYETILKLWKHRSFYKNGHRPYENYETILRALERLDPDNKHPYYYKEIKKQKRKSELKNTIEDKVQKLLDIAFVIDQAARVWIEAVFNQAANIAADERTKAYIQNAVGIDNDSDTRVIIKLMQEELSDNEKVSIKKLQQKKRERLRSRIEQLEAFNKINKELLKIFESESQLL